jgi:Zn-dependent protease with chaperone function
MAYVESVVLLLLSTASFLMLLFLFFDFVFSSSIRYYAKKSVPVAKSGTYKVFSEVFETVRRRFALDNIELYIMNTNEINAYAVGSLRRNIVVLTTGLLSLYRFEVNDNKKFFASIEGIIAHEMSHVINKDYFAALLLMVNERSTHFVSGIVAAIFELISRILSLIPIIGQYMTLAVDTAYSVIDFVIGFFYKYIMLNIYKFIQLQISKSVEYRADEQAAMVVGGHNMARTLGLLGSSGYFSIFSSHPLTRNRVKNVSGIKKSENIMKPVSGTNLTFILSFTIILATLYFSYRLAKIQALIDAYRGMVLFFKNKYIMLKTQITIFLNKYFAK